MGSSESVNKIDPLPTTCFLFGGLRDDASGEFTAYRQARLMKSFSIPGATAKIYGYKLYSGGWLWKKAILVKSKDINDFVIGRIVKFNESNQENQTFTDVLNEIDEFNKCKPKQDNDEDFTFRVVTDAYLESDELRSNPISVIIYERDKIDETDKEDSVIISNDWMKQNVLGTEIKSTTTNRIRSSKRGIRLLSRERGRRYFKEWQPNIDYQKDIIICMDVQRRWNDDIECFKFWAMCMKQHKSDETNKPKKGDIFADLLLNIIPFIRVYLIEHVEGFNNELATIIIDFCYSANEYWWNGCGPQNELYDEDDAKAKVCRCGNLVAGIFCETHCKKCKIIADQGSDSKVVTKIANIGCIMTLRKTDQTVVREYKDNNDNDANEQKNTENIILRTNIESNEERQKIGNLMERNFNEGMSPLIRASVKGEKSFIYKYEDKDIKVNIGETNIWGLYRVNDETFGNDEELLCGLIWRWVHGARRHKSRLMFEVLFLSTYENVRFNRYGQQMVSKIELYCIANGYDLISVAAVPGHGESFWKSNGFKEKHSAPLSKDRHKEDAWLRQNMLVFDDTPLFAKHL